MVSNYLKLIKKDKYQVFIFTCPANIPFNFVIHTWIVCNKKGKLTRYEVRHAKNKKNTVLHLNLFPIFKGIEVFLISNKWYWKGRLLGKIEGDLAKDIIAFVKKSETDYPYLDKHVLLGPNCNTYVQWILDSFPNLKIKLPWNAIGKNYIKNKKKELNYLSFN